MRASRSLRIHGPRGIVERAIEAVAARLGVGDTRTAESASITEVMSRDVVCAFPELAFGTLLEVMVSERLGSVPVVNELGHPIGMVTKLDVVEHLAAPNRLRPLVSDIMMPLAITLPDDATVADAATLMASEDMHHVLVVSGRRLIGVVSTMDVTRWLADSIARRR